jgi:hypothetical protein
MMKTARAPWALLATSLLLVVRHAAAQEAKAEASAYASGGDASGSAKAEVLGGGTAYAATQADACANKDQVTFWSPYAYKAEYGEASQLHHDCCVRCSCVVHHQCWKHRIVKFAIAWHGSTIVYMCTARYR